jgi:hypothetical protein
MALASHRIDCTRCGSPLEIRSPRSKSIACGHCHALIDLTSDAHAFLEELRADPIEHPLRVGMSGTLKGLRCTILGHVRYREESWSWDEYLVMSDEGHVAWIQHDDGSFKLFVPFVPSRPEPVSGASSALVADGRRDPVVERGSATLERIEGELTWRARIGDVVQYLEGRRLCVEIGATEMEWFTVESLPRGAVAKAFGLSPGSVPSLATKPAPFVIVLVVLFLCLISCCCLVPSCDDGYDDDYGYGGGHFQPAGWSGGK